MDRFCSSLLRDVTRTTTHLFLLHALALQHVADAGDELALIVRNKRHERLLALTVQHHHDARVVGRRRRMVWNVDARRLLDVRACANSRDKKQNARLHEG